MKQQPYEYIEVNEMGKCIVNYTYNTPKILIKRRKGEKARIFKRKDRVKEGHITALQVAKRLPRLLTSCWG